jgi:hypothetical protein
MHDITTRTERYELFIAPSWAAQEPGVGLLPHRKQNLAGGSILNTRANGIIADLGFWGNYCIMQMTKPRLVHD